MVSRSLCKPVSISSLPVEILIMIFGNLDTGAHEPSEERFPYRIMSVCTLWKEIVITTPQFWTQFAVALNHRHTSFKDFESHLQWSRNLPFEVLLTSLYNNPLGKNEGSRLSLALRTLSPHLHRCKRLSIQLLKSSSLPPFPKIVDFLSNCQTLDILELECILHDECVKPCPGTSDAAISSITWRFPPISELSLTGDSIFLYKKFFDPSPFHTLRHLTLGSYDASACRGEQPGLTTSSLIAMLRATRAEWITLENLCVCPEAFEVGPLDGAGPSILQCKYLPEDVIFAVHALYQNHPIDKLSVTSSPIDSLDRFLGDNLFLEEISEDRSEFLFDVIKDWSGRRLWIANCPLTNNSLLKAMTKKMVGEPYACPRLRELELHACSDLSVSALKRLVKFRWEEARKEFEWKDDQEMKTHNFEQVSPIVKLEVDGELGALFSEKDVEWFESKLHLVRYPLSSSDEDSHSDSEMDGGSDGDGDSDKDGHSDDDSGSDAETGRDSGSDEDGGSNEEEEHNDDLNESERAFSS